MVFAIFFMKNHTIHIYPLPHHQDSFSFLFRFSLPIPFSFPSSFFFSPLFSFSNPLSHSLSNSSPKPLSYSFSQTPTKKEKRFLFFFVSFLPLLLRFLSSPRPHQTNFHSQAGRKMQLWRVIPLLPLLFLVLTLSFPSPSTSQSASSIPPSPPPTPTPTPTPPPPCLVPFHPREGFFNGFIRSIHVCQKFSCAGFKYQPGKFNFENCENVMVSKNLSRCERYNPSPTSYANYKKYQELFDFSDEDCGLLPSSEPDYDIFVHFRQGDFAEEKHKRVNTPSVEQLIELITHIQNVSEYKKVYIETDGPNEWAIEQNYAVSDVQEKLGIDRNNCTIQASHCEKKNNVCMAKELLCILSHANRAKLTIGTYSSNVFRVLCRGRAESCFDWSGLPPIFGSWDKRKYKKYKFRLEPSKRLYEKFYTMHKLSGKL